MGRRTVLAGENMTLTTAVDVLAAFQTAAAGSAAAIVKLTRIEITQSGSTTTGMVRGQLAMRNTLGTLTTTSQAPTATQPVGGAASGLAGNASVIGAAGRSGINASVDSGGTYTPLIPFAFANLNGYLWKPDGYGEELLIPPSTVFVVRFLADPATLTGWTVSIYLDEM